MQASAAVFLVLLVFPNSSFETEVLHKFCISSIEIMCKL